MLFSLHELAISVKKRNEKKQETMNNNHSADTQ